MSIRQLKTNEVASVLSQIVVKQGKVCAVCGKPFTPRDRPVLDHDHSTGFIRGALHNSCNGTEGKLKVAAQRGHKGVPSVDFLIGLGKYLELHKKPKYPLLHPTHRSPEKIREERNKKAREARARKKTLK